MLRLVLLSLLCTIGTVQADTAETPAVPLAPGYSSLGYPLPEAGSYKLPPFEQAANGEIVDSNGKAQGLHTIFGDRYVLLSFMYSSCSDINGCPLSAFVFYQLKTAMAKDPVLAEHLKLVSLSFDPNKDTPDVMKLYANNFKYAKGDGEWDFATTQSQEQLTPILEAYSQGIQQKLSTDNDPTNDFSHVLRVFLIDPQKQIRNIYSVSFLHTDLILADLKTLLMEEKALQPNNLIKTAAANDHLIGPGDRKDGYASTDYETRSLSVQSREGKSTDLMSLIKNPPLGLPPVNIPDDLDISPSTIELGRKLFFDRRLSQNDTFSCAMCHIPEQGFANNELAKAVGIEGRSVRRNTPTVLNISYATKLFHDGREDTLTQQVWGPLLAKNEMGNPSIGYVINKLKRLPDYQGKFEAAFDGKSANMKTIGNALAAYQMTLNSADSAFDRWKFGKQQDAVSQEVKDGFTLFNGKALCSSCHLVSDNHALLTNNQMHNTGIGFVSSRVDKETTTKVQLAPGVFVDVKKEIIARVGKPAPADLGLYEITENPADRWKFKTPTLRNVALTAPYMHDGSLSTLRDVVDFYNQGGIQNEELDPLIQPLGLTDKESDALVAFMASLTGSNIPELVADAFAAPVGDVNKNDPHWSDALNAGTQ